MSNVIAKRYKYIAYLNNYHTISIGLFSDA